MAVRIEREAWDNRPAPMYLLLALSAAVAYGAADFLGGLASRRARIVPVIVVMQALALVLVLAASPLMSSRPALPDFGWGAGAGFAYGVGLLLLYRGLAWGRMSVVAPITGVSALAFPVLFGLFIGEEPGAWALAGIALAVVAIVLISRESDQASDSAAVGALPGAAVSSSERPARGVHAVAIGSGAAFGLFFILLARTDAEAGLWPLVGARCVTVAGFTALALLTKQALRLPRPALHAALAGGVLDIGANTLYLLSVQDGLLSLAATLTSLYPATTVLLAAVVLRERIRAVQAAGLAVAAAAVLLITATQ